MKEDKEVRLRVGVRKGNVKGGAEKYNVMGRDTVKDIHTHRNYISLDPNITINSCVVGMGFLFEPHNFFCTS